MEVCAGFYVEVAHVVATVRVVVSVVRRVVERERECVPKDFLYAEPDAVFFEFEAETGFLEETG